tara:strand:- start:252 stop:716 length:465 start_codon:yes stop_codon:yes gene_type:complete
MVKSKKSRDPNRPKRPLTAFMRFSKSKRQELKLKYPDKSMTDLSKLIGVAWKAADDLEKRPFQESAASDHELYRKEIEKYNKRKPKRPRTAYAFFMQTERSKVAKKYPEKNPRELMQYIALAWKQLSKEEKQTYTDMAVEDRQRWTNEKNNSTQ